MSRLLFIFFIVVLMPLRAFGQTDVQEASDFIDELGKKAVEILRDQSIDLAEREDALAQIVSKSFDVNLIGRFVLGKAWNTASQAERDEYLALFTSYMLQNYTKRLGGYSGQTLKVMGGRDYKGRDAVVSTVIHQESGDPIKIAWLVRETGAGMRILDVIVGGKSLTLTQKKDFRSVISRKKLSGLLQLLRLKVSKRSVQS